MRRGLYLLPALLTLAGCQDHEYTPSTPPAVPVRSEVLKAGPFEAEVLVLGTVRPSSTVAIVAGAAGTVRYPPRFAGGLRTGESVRAGETLAVVESEALRLRRAETALEAERAAHELEVAERMNAAGLSTRNDLLQRRAEVALTAARKESAERDAERLQLRAPRAGRLVVTKATPAGSMVGATDVLAELASDGPRTVEGFAPATERGRLAATQRVRFTLSGRAGDVGTGRLREVASVVDAAGTLRLVADVVDAGPALPAPGEGVEMRVLAGGGGAVLTVSEEALVGGAVFVLDKGEGRTSLARRQPITIGGHAGGRVEVLSGLHDGDRVAVSGASFLTDGVLTIEPAPARTPAP